MLADDVFELVYDGKSVIVGVESIVPVSTDEIATDDFDARIDGIRGSLDLEAARDVLAVEFRDDVGMA